MRTLLAIFIGGGAGSLLRYGIGRAVGSFHNAPFPLGTFFANILSCIVLALVMLGISKLPGSAFHWKALLIIGFCGGLSTFSTFSMESFQLLKEGYWEWSLLNIGTSVGGCLLILYLVGGRVL